MKVDRYRQRAEQEGAAAQEELELARQGCRRDMEALHAAHAAVNHTGLGPYRRADQGPRQVLLRTRLSLTLDSQAQQAAKAQFDEELAQLAAHAEAAQAARQRGMEHEKAAYEQRLQERMAYGLSCCRLAAWHTYGLS